MTRVTLCADSSLKEKSICVRVRVCPMVSERVGGW
jgi:hypothetical protein